jgi:bacillithiol biosynthesis cysteine-adding enzyme BshC
MESTCLRLTELPNTSRLFADYTYNFEQVARYYDHAPQDFHSAAARIDYPVERRQALVAALREQNGESPLLDELARPGTLAVVTGQQVGLFGGPAYTIFKALSATALARRLNQEGIPCVPVFWLATEDHDFAEVNHAWVFDHAHRPVRAEVPDHNPSRRPVGRIPVDSTGLPALRAALEGFPFGEEALALVEQSYAPGRDFGSAFSSLMRGLLGAHKLLYFDPMHASSRRLAAPLIRDALAAAPELAALVLERNQDLAARGYHAQVHFEEQTSLVFLLENERRVALHRQGPEYAANGRRLSAAELADRAEELSPNALLRPVVQDYLLPTVAYVGGPAELAYLAQAQVIYHRLLGRMPVAVHRQSSTLLDARSGKLLARYNLSIADFFHGEDALKERMAQRLVPPELGHAFDRTLAQANRLFDELGAALGQFDSSLAAAFATSRRKIAFQLSKTERKAAREAMRRNERAVEDARYLADLIYPNRHLQERLYSILPFVARHGAGLIDRLAGEFTRTCPDHRVIVL